MNEQLRRRSVGTPAARSMLLTVLGEFVLPRRGRGVWQEVLVEALRALGYSAPAARQAVSRSTRAGWLVAERRGRRAQMTLTRPTAQLLSEGTRRIFSFGATDGWDGRWLLVAVRVPEERRDIRHQMRTRLAWAGLGSLGGGLWLTPHVEREGEIRDAVSGGTAADIVSFRATIGELGSTERVVKAAWDLDAVAAQYDNFIAGFSRLRPAGPEPAFRALTTMVHEWRKFPFVDPDLPGALLPSHWPKQRAYELFHDRHARWHGDAVEHFESLGSD